MTTELEKYSFSGLSSFESCPYGFYLRYIEKAEEEGNCFSSYGTLMHSLLERHNKGELPPSNLASTFMWEFESAVPEPFPPNKYADLKELYYTQGLAFFNQFRGNDQIEKIGIEAEFEVQINDWILRGVSDLIYKDKRGIIVLDYKSKAKFKSKDEQSKYARQLYLYSKYVKETYGEFPKYLEFDMFRKQHRVVIPFNEDDYNEAIEWADSIVKKIRTAWVYPQVEDDFFCRYLCSYRSQCDIGKQAVKGWRKQ